LSSNFADTLASLLEISPRLISRLKITPDHD
jgi:hypothetical protein